jgi:DUF1680 family protein
VGAVLHHSQNHGRQSRHVRAIAATSKRSTSPRKWRRWTADYTRSFSYEHMQRVLGTEYGGMGEVLANLYAVTGKEHYLEVAQRFDQERILRSAGRPSR